MMTCEEFTARVTDYLEGNVPFGERIGMWLHTLLCHHCRRYLEQMKKTVDTLHKVGEMEEEKGPPDETKRKLLEEYRTEHSD